MKSGLLPDIQTARWYEDKVRRYGYDHRGLGFNNRSSQERRFEALLGLGDFNGRHLLDVGCGFGDFLQFLQGRGVEPRYTGIDLCVPMIARCRERFADCDAEFIAGDALDYQPDRPFDYVVASGIFGLDAPGTRERVAPTLHRLFDWAQRGCAANFLSGRARSKAEERVYLDPVEVLQMGLELTPAVRLDHTYLPNDFTLYLYPRPAWDDGKARTTT